MLKRLHLKNFTVFADADFEFGPGLNVLVGTNGTGKSHVLKVGYATLSVAAKLFQWENSGLESTLIKSNFYKELHDKLKGVFQPEQENINHLVRWESVQNNSTLKAGFSEEDSFKTYFDISKNDSYKKLVDNAKVENNPRIENIDKPVFIPAKEILTLSWIIRIAEYRSLPLDETYLDLLHSLRQSSSMRPEGVVIEVIAMLEILLGGAIKQIGDRFYVISKKGTRVEMELVAEGLRKFGTLQKLLANGSLTKNSTLFWDEPEANLNPALLRKLAAILAELARQGFQIILATHSMSLLKAFHILSREKDKEKLPIKYFGLNAEPGQATTVVTRKDFEYLPDVVALAVELEQADELEDIFAREDREYYANNRGEE